MPFATINGQISKDTDPTHPSDMPPATLTISLRDLGRQCCFIGTPQPINGEETNDSFPPLSRSDEYGEWHVWGNSAESRETARVTGLGRNEPFVGGARLIGLVEIRYEQRPSSLGTPR